MCGRPGPREVAMGRQRAAAAFITVCGYTLVDVADAGGLIFTGHIEASCVATMMVKMLLFAMAWEFATGRVEQKVRARAMPAAARVAS